MGTEILSGLFGVSGALIVLAVTLAVLGPIYVAIWVRPRGPNRPSRLWLALPLTIAGLAIAGAFGVGYFGALTTP